MKLVYHLSDAARKQLFVETGRDPGQVQGLEVDPAVLSSADRALIAELNPSLGTVVHLSYPDWIGFRAGPAWLELGAIATDPAELVAAYRNARAAGLARVDSGEAERISGEIETYRAWDSEREPGILNTGMYRQSPRREEWIAAHAAATAAAKARQATLAEQRRQDAARQEAEKQRRIDERRVWALEHGSSRLKKCVAGDYDCQRLYVTERAALEFPGFVVDFDDKAEWKVRSGPSEAALDEAMRVGGEVVWMTRHPDDEDEQEGEAVVIRFLGKYDLVKAM